jgi:serine/threonine-protein kinase
MLGSPLYMSPEHIQSSRNVDARTDTWALGVILYELVTGHAPFGGDHIAELMFNIISAPPTPMRTYRANVPEAFERVVSRCLEKNRDVRYSSIAELAVALFPFAPARSASSVERITGVATGAHPASGLATVAIGPKNIAESQQTDARPASAATQAAWGQTNADKTRTSTWLAVGAAGAGALLIAGLVAAKGLSPAPEVSAATGSASALATLTPSAKSPDSLVPEPPAPPASAATPTPSVSAASLTSSSAASVQLKPPPHTKPKPPATAAPPRDPWGGSQH